jgi:multisubunit Na+/H+ antiporter MnhE subunit
MIRWALLTASLTGVYLLVLASAKPGDVLIGALISGVLAAVLLRSAHPAPEPGEHPLLARLAAAPRFVALTLVDLAKGTWHVASFALGRRSVEHPGLVEIPMDERTEAGVVAWGLLTAISPDEVVVDIDEERRVAIVHVLDDRDPDAVRARHRAAYERTTRKVFP